MKTSLEKRIEAERKKLKALDGPQRFRYILDYYGLWIAGGIIAVILLVYLIFHMFFTVKDFQLYGIFANTTADAGTVSVLKQDYAAWRSGLPASEGSDKMEFHPLSYNTQQCHNETSQYLLI